MTPIPFRSAAVVCGIVTASLGVGLVSPAVASATTAPAASQTGDARPAEQDTPIGSIPVDPAIGAPQILSIEDTAVGSRAVMGNAGSDELYLLDGETTVSAWPGGSGLFLLRALDKYRDSSLDIVRVHTASDGTKTRTERTALPRTLQVEGLREQNEFTPGTTAFHGTATAGATITATDTDGSTLFTTDVAATTAAATDVAATTAAATDVAAAEAAAGAWTADAELTDADHQITFTQTLPDGRTSVINRVAFTPGAATAPAAPVVQPAERTLDGAFTLWGSVDEATTAVEVRDADGTKVGETRVTNGEFTATIPQEHIGTSVDVVAIAADGTESAPTPAELTPLPTSADVTKPAVREVNVLPNGTIQVIGEVQPVPGTQVLDGDTVVGSIAPGSNGWTLRIDEDFTGKQLDLVNLAFDGQRYSAMSERVALPRLLEVDGIEAENTYKPGERTFSGSAEAGATIVATDAAGTELFRAETKQNRSGVAAWEASADLTSKDGYEITFTQTTADGRTSVMKDITFTPDEDVAPQDLTLTSHRSGGTFMPGPQRFSGTATPGATVEFNPFGWSPAMAGYTLTTTADATTGAWTIERGLADVEYHVLAFRQDVDADVVQQITGVRLTPEATADLVLTSPGDRFTPGTVQTFTGTATPGTTVTLDPFGDSEQYAAYRLTATADTTTGEWTITRPLADSKYLVVLTQADSGLKVKRIVHPMQPAN